MSVAAPSSMFASSPAVKQGGQMLSVSSVLSQGKGGGASASAVLMPGALKSILLSQTPWLSVGCGQ